MAKSDEILNETEVLKVDPKRLKLSIGNDSSPDLQLSLSPNLKCNAASFKPKLATEEGADSKLSLSLSPPSFMQRLLNTSSNSQTNKSSLERESTNEAAAGPSTLDLTMSIKALE
jgi:hypothetical protein